MRHTELNMKLQEIESNEKIRLLEIATTSSAAVEDHLERLNEYLTPRKRSGTSIAALDGNKKRLEMKYELEKIRVNEKVQLAKEKLEFEKQIRQSELNIKLKEIESNEKIRLLQIASNEKIKLLELEKQERMERLQLELRFKFDTEKIKKQN